MRQAVVNLTRLGDLLQTQPLITALKRQGHEINLICLENFAGAARLLQGVDRVSALPGAALLAGVKGGWPGALARLQMWVAQEKKEFAAQRVINLTASTGARLLTRLLAEGAEQGGFGLDEMGFGVSGNAWATYVQAATLNRGCSPINLVDGFRAMAGVADVAPEFVLHGPDVDVSALVPQAEGVRGLLALQLGASAEQRRWPVEYFARVGESIWRAEGLLPVLLGSAAEAGLAREYAEHAAGAPFADLTGATDLVQLAGVLRVSRLLVSNDTGTMHLAAGLGLPVLAIFLATAQPWDTGPYAQDACSLEPDMACHPCAFGKACTNGGQCRVVVKPDLVSELALGKLRQGEWQAQEGERGARVWISCRQPQDSRAFLDLRPLWKNAAWAVSDRVRWIRQQRKFYRQFLDEVSGLEMVSQEPVSGLSPELGLRLGGVLEHTAALAHLLAGQGRVLELAPRPEAGQAFLQTSRRLSDLLAATPELCVLSHLWKAALQDLGGDLSGLGNFLRIMRARVLDMRAAIGQERAL